MVTDDKINDIAQRQTVIGLSAQSARSANLTIPSCAGAVLYRYDIPFLRKPSRIDDKYFEFGMMMITRSSTSKDWISSAMMLASHESEGTSQKGDLLALRHGVREGRLGFGHTLGVEFVYDGSCATKNVFWATPALGKASDLNLLCKVGGEVLDVVWRASTKRVYALVVVTNNE